MLNNYVNIEGNDAFGFGLSVTNYTSSKFNKSFKIYYRDGKTKTFATKIAFVPELNLAGAFFTNTNDLLFTPANEILINFYSILVGDEPEINSNYTFKIILIDSIVFGSILLAIILILVQVIRICKKCDEEARWCCMTFNIIAHLVIPSVMLILSILYIVLLKKSFTYLFICFASFVVWVLIAVPLFYLGGIIKVLYVIYLCCKKRIDRNEKLKDIERMDGPLGDFIYEN